MKIKKEGAAKQTLIISSEEVVFDENCIGEVSEELGVRILSERIPGYSVVSEEAKVPSKPEEPAKVEEPAKIEEPTKPEAPKKAEKGK